jgi:hypothetical protein
MENHRFFNNFVKSSVEKTFFWNEIVRFCQPIFPCKTLNINKL